MTQFISGSREEEEIIALARKMISIGKKLQTQKIISNKTGFSDYGILECS